MKASFFIAFRYLISKKSSNFINVVSKLAIVGVALGTMALVVVLSIFNGLEDLIRSIYGNFEPEIKITASYGKSFERDTTIISKIQKIEGVNVFAEVIEDNALVKYGQNQTIVKVKGIDNSFSQMYGIKNFVKEGYPSLSQFGLPKAIVGQGIQYRLGIDLNNRFYALSFWYPRSDVKWTQNPENIFNNLFIYPGGIFALEKQYDDQYIFVPLDFAEKLMQYENIRTAYEIKLSPSSSTENVIKKIKNIVGNKFLVKTRDEQNESLLKAIKIEKLFVYFTFTFILAVLCLNIFFSITMQAIEKQKDIKMLKNMGATNAFVKNIFIINGIATGIIGAFIGLVLGFVLCYGQLKYGWLSVGDTTTLLSAYPVKMQVSDFILSSIIIIVVTFLVSLQPAHKASKM